MPALGFTFDKLFWFDRIEAAAHDPGTVRVYGAHTINPYTGELEDNNGKVLTIGEDKAIKWLGSTNHAHERFSYDKAKGTLCNHPTGIPRNDVNVLFVVENIP